MELMYYFEDDVNYTYSKYRRAFRQRLLFPPLASADSPLPDPPVSPEIRWLDYLSPRTSCKVRRSGNWA